MFDYLHTLDLSLFYTLFHLSGWGAWSDWLIIFCAQYLIYFVLLAIAYEGWRVWHEGRAAAWQVYCVALGGALFARFGVAEAIRFFYHHPRPYAALNLHPLLTDAAYSFPSGHTIFIFALGAGLYGVHKKLACGIFAVGLLIGAARVAAGVHYPSDILGGIVLGLGVGYLTSQAWLYIRRRVGVQYL